MVGSPPSGGFPDNDPYGHLGRVVRAMVMTWVVVVMTWVVVGRVGWECSPERLDFSFGEIGRLGGEL